MHIFDFWRLWTISSYVLALRDYTCLTTRAQDLHNFHQVLQALNTVHFCLKYLQINSPPLSPLKLAKILHCWNKNHFWIGWILFICHIYMCFLFDSALDGQACLNVSSVRFPSWSVFWGGSAYKYEMVSFRNLKRLFVNSPLYFPKPWIS